MLRVWDNGGETTDRYTVVVGEDVYYMSENANMPNGVCMYGGRLDEGEPMGDEMPGIGSLPAGTLIAIVRLLEELLEDAMVKAGEIEPA